MAAVPEPGEQGAGEHLVSQEAAPVVVVEIRGDDCGALGRVAVLHELEEDVGLLGVEVEVAQLVDEQDFVSAEPVQELTGTPPSGGTTSAMGWRPVSGPASG